MAAPAAARSPGRRRRTSWPGRGGVPARSSRPSRVTVMRAPEQPSGWPSAIAPPSALTISSSSPRSRMQASDWEAKASLSSTASRSSIVQPARVEHLASGGHRADAHDVRRDAGVGAGDQRERAACRPARSAYRSLTSTTAAAPSLSELELPAVMTPPGPWIGRSCASFSRRGVGPRTLVLRSPRRPRRSRRRSGRSSGPPAPAGASAARTRRAPRASGSSARRRARRSAAW